MEQIGEYLRGEREKQGRTLEDIARATRIARDTLRIIESGADDTLPSASYLRGFVKLYARELGLSIDDVLDRLPTQETENIRVALPRSIDFDRPKRPPARICLLVVLLCAACLWAGQFFFGFELLVQDEDPLTAFVSPRPALPEEAPSNAVFTQALLQPQLDTEQEQADPQDVEPVQPAVAAEPETGPFTVRFAARGTVWLRLRADEREPDEITLRRGERYRIAAEHTLQLRVGNPALVDVWYNDIPVSLAGIPGRPLDTVFPGNILQDTSN